MGSPNTVSHLLTLRSSPSLLVLDRPRDRTVHSRRVSVNMGSSGLSPLEWGEWVPAEASHGPSPSPGRAGTVGKI